MTSRPINSILLIEDNAGDARLLREMLKPEDAQNIHLTHVVSMSAAEQRLAQETFDIILLDLRLPDVWGLEAVRRARVAAPRMPLVVLTGSNDEELAAQTLHEGAQDYLIKGEIETRGLLRALRYAIEREHSEARLEESNELLGATLRAVPYAIVCLDRQQRVQIWNRAAEENFGYSEHELLGSSYPLVPEEGCVEFEALHARVFAGETLRDIRLQHRRKDGELRQISYAAAPIHDGPRIRGIVASLEDVTDHAGLEERFIQAQKMEAIGNLTGGMAHDFNNLLAVVIGNLDLLRPMLPAHGQAIELADESFEAAWRGAKLTKRLLAFARRQSLTPQCIILNDLVRNTVKLLERTLGEEVVIALALSEQVWPVMVDPAQFEAAITNLATNARDSMPTGGRLDLVTRNCSLDEDYAAAHPDVTVGDYVMIEVSDNGAGIAPEVVGKIFDPFYTTKTEGYGTGLGLSMVFGFMRQSGGHIHVHSEVGLGTTFRLYLPRSFEGVDRPGLAKVEDTVGGGETVLVVEDNAALRRVAVRQLLELGYEVMEADSGAAAIDVLERESIDIVFSDVVMPGGLDGYALERHVAAVWPNIKVVLTSGYAANEATVGASRPGVRLLNKPYRRNHLAIAIREALDS